MISVIVPVYNVENYLRQCIESILNQTYTDFEIILVDDGSLDSSGNICDEYSEKFTNISVLHKKNEGLGYARNSGIEKACGEFIVFVDSDDYVEENMLLDLYNGLMESECDTCMGGHNRVNMKNEFVSSHSYEKTLFKYEQVIKEFIPRFIGSAPEKSDCVSTAAWNVLYSIDIINRNNLKFPSERELISEDIIFNLDYFKYSTGVSLIETCNYNYRINNNSLTTNYNKDRFELIKKLYFVERKKLKKLGIYDIAKYRLMRQFFNYLRMCFKQEDTLVSKLSYKNALTNIKEICSDTLVESIISEFPVYKLGMIQKIFVLLVKYKFNIILYLCIKFKFI